MAAFVAATSNTMLDWLTGKTTPAAVATRYITTYNGDPQAGGTENINTITGSANRQPITAAMAAAAAASATNSISAITFTTAAVAAATVNFVAIMSAITGGTVMASAAVTAKTVAIGDGLSIPLSNLTASIT